MEKAEDQSILSNKVAPFLNHQRDRVPAVLIVGVKRPHCLTKVPHRYNVLAIYQNIDIRSEKVKGKVVCRVRSEMIDLKTPSWCGVHGSPRWYSVWEMSSCLATRMTEPTPFDVPFDIARFRDQSALYVSASPIAPSRTAPSFQAFPPIMLSMSTTNCGGTGLRNPRKTSLKLLSSLASRKSQTRLSYHGLWNPEALTSLGTSLLPLENAAQILQEQIKRFGEEQKVKAGQRDEKVVDLEDTTGDRVSHLEAQASVNLVELSKVPFQSAESRGRCQEYNTKPSRADANQEPIDDDKIASTAGLRCNPSGSSNALLKDNEILSPTFTSLGTVPTSPKQAGNASLSKTRLLLIQRLDRSYVNNDDSVHIDGVDQEREVEWDKHSSTLSNDDDDARERKQCRPRIMENDSTHDFIGEQLAKANKPYACIPQEPEGYMEMSMLTEEKEANEGRVEDFGIR
ncbi:hypothetical protein HO173_006200 [Letharia columbiana]|uniref:Uncharacterized protein n=1 Tax=Letharia columbiana TaxID=112416 RepID=A0A8H6L4T2_9LECA|nr:uncharacterized protein HO173_006200 [Letharia columbiana]KAF6235517.1 hypothetical protein HO173_006200 [Letharia columbiana]